MQGFDAFHSYAEELDKRLRLGTFPLAVKLLEKEGDIPEGARRPVKEFGYHLSTCQAFSMSRRQGVLLVMLKEDMWCFEPVIGYGLAEPPQYFLDGHNRFPRSVASLEAGSNWAQAFPRLELDKYVGVVSAPLMTVNFEPDVVVIYCNPAQLTQLLLSAEYKDGRDIACTLSGRAACVYSVVPVAQTGRFQVALPCPGDRRWAGAQDNEIIFSAPKERLEELMVGLRCRDDFMRGQPTMFSFRPEYELEESYAKIAGMLGMQVDK